MALRATLLTGPLFLILGWHISAWAATCEERLLELSFSMANMSSDKKSAISSLWLKWQANSMLKQECPEGYVERAIRNKLRDSYRKNRGLVLIDDLDDWTHQHAEVRQSAASIERLSLFEGELGKLPPERIKAIRLYAAGKTSAEVAAELNVKAATVRQWFHRLADVVRLKHGGRIVGRAAKGAARGIGKAAIKLLGVLMIWDLACIWIPDMGVCLLEQEE